MPDATAIKLEALKLHLGAALAALDRARGYCDCVAGLDAINDARVSTMEVRWALSALAATRERRALPS